MVKASFWNSSTCALSPSLEEANSISSVVVFIEAGKWTGIMNTFLRYRRYAVQRSEDLIERVEVIDSSVRLTKEWRMEVKELRLCCFNLR
jgi:hypothetical protein